MKIEETGLEGKESVLVNLDHATEELGFARGSWDYKRATYDLKYDDRQTRSTYYLRVPVTSIKGEVHDDGSRDSIVKVGTPYIGRATQPFGVEYNCEFPKHIVENAKKILAALNSMI